MSYSASEPEAQDLGFTLPKGTDLIRDGDDAITTNALVTTGALRAAFNRLRTLEDAALAAAQAVNRDSSTGRLYYAKVTPPIMVDDFNRPDESPVSPTPIGGKPLLSGSGATLSVTGNQLAMHGSVTRTGFWDAGQADGVYRITVADTGWNGTGHAFGVLFRASGPDWSDALILRGNGSNYGIQTRSGGAYGSFLSGVTTHPASNGDQVEVIMSGASVTVRVNGNVVYDAAPPGSWTGTHVGVMNLANRDAVRFDDVSFEQIGA